MGRSVEAIRQGDIPGVQLRLRRRIPVAPEALWRRLTEPAAMVGWLADRAAVELAVGGAVELETACADGTTRIEQGRTLAVEAPRLWRLAWRWRHPAWRASTRLTFSVAPRGAATELSILEQGFESLSLSDCLTVWERSRDRWREALDRLEHLAPPPPAEETESAG